MKIFEKNKAENNSTNLLYAVGMDETWLIQWKQIGKSIQIDACLRFEGEIPLPKKGYKESTNKQLSEVAKNIIGSLKRLTMQEVK